MQKCFPTPLTSALPRPAQPTLIQQTWTRVARTPGVWDTYSASSQVRWKINNMYYSARPSERSEVKILLSRNFARWQTEKSMSWLTCILDWKRLALLVHHVRLAYFSPSFLSELFTLQFSTLIPKQGNFVGGLVNSCSWHCGCVSLQKFSRALWDSDTAWVENLTLKFNKRFGELQKCHIAT